VIICRIGGMTVSDTWRRAGLGSGSNSDWDDHARRARSSRYLGFVMLSGSCGWASMQEQEQKGREDAGDGICFA